jgi:Transposase DDE domain
VFRIARRVARDRVISTVDTQARHGHKSRNRRFDGYKAHLSVDPDSELIDEVAGTAANAPDRDAAAELLDDHARRDAKPEVVGDAAYGDATTRAGLEEQGFTVVARCPPARNAGGRFPKDRFTVDLGAGTVTCPAGHAAPIVPSGRGGKAAFWAWCAAWQQQYRTDRPVVERKVSHSTRRPWGGRKARTRGLARITTDLHTRAGAINWARLAVLGLGHDETGWILAAT